jgi:hypothetical protein
MCCDRCHRPIQPGTERALWDGLKRRLRVCATCVAFGTSVVFGQISPPEAPPPVMINVLSPSIYTNTAAGTTLLGPDQYTSVVTVVQPSLPLWASLEQQKAHQKLSRESFKLSPADQARLRSR